MIIPKRFKLVNRTWKVRIVSRKTMAKKAEDPIDKAPRGMCDPYTATIYLRRDQEPEDMMHSFWHEVGHALLFAVGAYEDKMHNEILVDQFGGLMAQFWTTAKGDVVL